MPLTGRTRDPARLQAIARRPSRPVETANWPSSHPGDAPPAISPEPRWHPGLRARPGARSSGVEGGTLGQTRRASTRWSPTSPAGPPLGLSGRWSADRDARGDTDGVTLVGKSASIEPPAVRQVESPDLAGRSGPTIRLERPARPLRVHRLHRLRHDRRLRDSSKMRRAIAGSTSKGWSPPTSRRSMPCWSAGSSQGPRSRGSLEPSGPRGRSAETGRVAWKGLDAELGFDLAGADIYGMKFGPSPVVLRAKGRQALVRPDQHDAQRGTHPARARGRPRRPRRPDPPAGQELEHPRGQDQRRGLEASPGLRRPDPRPGDPGQRPGQRRPRPRRVPDRPGPGAAGQGRGGRRLPGRRVRPRAAGRARSSERSAGETSASSSTSPSP